MKRLAAIPAVVTALAFAGVAAVPASAGTIEYDGVTATCVQTNVATYTVSYKTHSVTFVLGKKCLF